MKEADIRPQAIFDEYLRLCAQDTTTYFGAATLTAVACPGCDAQGRPAFSKNGFAYQVCGACETLYVSPRPPASAFEEYYRNAPSSRFWADTFYKATADSRRKLLWEPKARLIYDKLVELNASAHAIVDIGGGYGLFAEEIRKLSRSEALVIEPSPRLAEVCRQKSLNVIEKFLEYVGPSDLPAKPKAFVSFELFEHLHDPRVFLRHLLNLMSSGDLFVFTTLSGTGFDIQLLWEHSKSVSPPHHLNFLNPRSIAMLLKRIGFETIEVSTPGKLDVDIVMNNRSLLRDRFWTTFFERSTEEERQLWQKTVSATGWSSHMMVICRKP
jgi:SAM-dependent methyltransferase